MGCVGAGVQPPAVSKTLRILVGLVPAGLVLISASLLYFYPITEAKRQVSTTIIMATKSVVKEFCLQRPSQLFVAKVCR